MQQLDFVTLCKQMFGPGTLSREEIEHLGGMEWVKDRQSSHKVMKKELGPRVQVLRVLVANKFKDRLKDFNDFEFGARVEKYLDNLLAKYGYQLEFIIDKLREQVTLDVTPVVCDKCGHRPVFCQC